MRLLRVLLVLAFGLAMVGPEAHHCPVHDQHGSAPASAPAHHQSADHQQQSHKLCTCPQACCPTGAAFSLPAAASAWTAPAATTAIALVPATSFLQLPFPRHRQPLAHAPPIARV